MENLQETTNRLAQFSDKTFNNGEFTRTRSLSILYHLDKEVKEAMTATRKVIHGGGSIDDIIALESEIADILILVLDYQRHFIPNTDHLLTIINNKMDVNEIREWGEPDENGVIEHIRK